MAYQRTTTLAGMIDKPDALIAWKAYHAIRGIVTDDATRAVASSMGDWDDDKGAAYNFVDKAAKAGGSERKSDLGTALHGFTERVDRGELTVDDIPADWRPDIVAYRAALERAGVQTHPDLVERTIVNVPLAVGGALDRVVRWQGGLYIADVKSGRIDFGTKIAAQLAVYANATAMWRGRGEAPKGQYGWYDIPDPALEPAAYEPMPAVNRERGIVVHLPPGEGRCELYWVDLTYGLHAARVAACVREARKGDRSAIDDQPIAPLEETP